MAQTLGVFPRRRLNRHATTGYFRNVAPTITTYMTPAVRGVSSRWSPPQKRQVTYDETLIERTMSTLINGSMALQLLPHHTPTQRPADAYTSTSPQIDHGRDRPQPHRPDTSWHRPQPNRPGNSWQPAQPQRPDNSWHRPQPNRPDNSWQPAQTQRPDNSWHRPQPYRPDNSWQPAQPQRPDNSWHRPQPYRPDNGWHPAQPQQPDTNCHRPQPYRPENDWNPAQPQRPDYQTTAYDEYQPQPQDRPYILNRTFPYQPFTSNRRMNSLTPNPS